MNRENQMCILSQRIIDILEFIQFIFKNATKNIDITYPQFMLMKLLQSKQPMTVGELVRLLGIDQGNGSNMCKKLEKKGWILRQRNPQDERVVLLSLTAQGEEILNHIHAYSQKKCKDVFYMLSDEEVEQAVQGLLTLVENCKKIVDQKGEN